MLRDAILLASDHFADALDRLARLRQPANLKDVDHAGPDFERHRDTIGAGFLRDAYGVVAQHLVFSQLNEQRRESAIIAEEGRSKRLPRITVAQVSLAELGHGTRTDDRIVNRLERLACQREVGGRRDGDRPEGLRGSGSHARDGV